MNRRELHRNLPRLERSAYQGFAHVHWILTMKHRRKGWLDEKFDAGFRETLLHTESRYSLVSPTYCLMPDHVHLLWMGITAESDQVVAMEFLRKYLKPVLAPFEFQQPPFDHILRRDERESNAFENAAHYILDNPIRAGLVTSRSDYPYSGALVPGYPDLDPNAEDYWPKFWRIYHKLTPDLYAPSSQP